MLAGGNKLLCDKWVMESLIQPICSKTRIHSGIVTCDSLYGWVIESFIELILQEKCNVWMIKLTIPLSDSLKKHVFIQDQSK